MLFTGTWHRFWEFFTCLAQSVEFVTLGLYPFIHLTLLWIWSFFFSKYSFGLAWHVNLLLTALNSFLQIIFFMIVVDRIIYLCSFAVGKVIFYLFSLILFTYSVTEYAWRLGPSQQQAGVLALRAIYLAKAVSLSLQAIQVRYGIPHQSTLYRQFLTSRVSRVNYLGYRLYRALPFLYELRCVLDWSCTTTSLTMYDWLKVNLSPFAPPPPSFPWEIKGQPSVSWFWSCCLNIFLLFYVVMCINSMPLFWSKVPGSN